MVAPGDTPLRCLERVGATELFDPRGDDRAWPPYARVGRFCQALGEPDPTSGSQRAARSTSVVYLADFGTARELYAADDTWSDAQVRDYLQLRANAASDLMPPPREVGVIVPPRPEDHLEPGMHVAPGHLEALPRLYMVDDRPCGVPLPLVIGGPAVSEWAAGALLVSLGSALMALHAQARATTNRALTPAHLDLAAWVAPAGGLVARVLFHYKPGVDYSVHSLPARALAAVRAEEEIARARLAGGLRRAFERLLEWGAFARERSRSWIPGLLALCEPLDRRADAWGDGRCDLPALFGDARDELAAHVARAWPEVLAASAALDDAVLAAPAADPGVPEWRTRPLPAR